MLSAIKLAGELPSYILTWFHESYYSGIDQWQSKLPKVRDLLNPFQVIFYCKNPMESLKV